MKNPIRLLSGAEHHEEEEQGCGENETIFSCNVLTLTIFVTAVVIFSSVFEFLRHRLDHWLEHRTQLRGVVDHIYKELTTLGMLSFTLFVAEKLGALNTSKERVHIYKELFELTHYLLFVLVVGYIVLIVLILVFTNHVSKSWHRRQARPSADAERDLPQRVADLDLLAGESSLPRCAARWLVGDARRAADDVGRWQKVVEFHGLRWQFVAFLESAEEPGTGETYSTAETLLAADGGFDFATYLGMSVHHVAIELAELSWTFWLPVLGLVWLNLLRYELMDLSPSEAVVLLAMIEGAAVLGIIWLHYRTSRTMRYVFNRFHIAKSAREVATNYSSNMPVGGGDSSGTGGNGGDSSIAINSSTAIQTDGAYPGLGGIGAARTESLLGAESGVGGGPDRLAALRGHFLLGRPVLHLRLLQVIMLFQSLYFIGAIYYYQFLPHPFLMIFMLIPPFLTFYLATRIVRYHSICSSLGPYTRWGLMREMRDDADKEANRRRREGTARPGEGGLHH
jgi:hypothetical protein